MSDDVTQKALDTAMQRIASLEAEVSASRKNANHIDPAALRQALTSDPIGSLTRLGLPIDHISKVFIANAMGDTAPPELKALAAMGPQISATNALDAQVKELHRQLSDMTAAQAKTAVRTSFSALTQDKTKYPNLAKALAADPTLLDGDLANVKGSAEEFATSMEARLSKIAAVFVPQTASPNPAETTTQSTQAKPNATASALSGEVPPIKDTPKGPLSNEDRARIRDEVIRKYTPTAAQ